LIYIKNLWAWCASCVILVTLSTISLVAGLFDKSGDTSHIIAGWWGKGIVTVSGIKVDVSGLENVDMSSQYIFLANHQSFYDIFILSAYLPLQFRYFIKKELYKVPFLNMAMWAARYIPIDRGESLSAMKSLKDGLKKIKQGKSILMFPEGTRSKDGKVSEFKRGSMLLASRARLSIVPVSISGTVGIMPKGSFLIQPTDVKLTFHKPIEVQRLTKEGQGELGEKIRNIVISGLT